jgi:hypothetical protein
VLFTACEFPLEVSPMEDLWELATQSKQVLRAAQSEEGVSAVLGAVDRVAKAGLDEYSAERGASCSNSTSTGRTSAR